MLVYQRVSFILVLGRIHRNSVHQALHEMEPRRSQVREIYSMAGANQGILVSSHICMLHAMAEGARTTEKTEIWLCHSCVTLGF